ncbi:MAG: lysophospholipid acyltransferase family protein [Pseudomonadota bacterium]
MTKLRSILFVASMMLSALIIGIVALPALLRRDWSLAISKFWCRTCLVSLKMLCGIDDQVHGSEHLPQGAAIIAAKHQSMWETLRLTTLLPQPSFVLKKELKHWPIFSWFARRNGFIFIDREAGASALRDMTNAAKAMAAEGAQIIIFPEGTRVQPDHDAEFQPGVAALAKALKVPTVPITHDSGKYWIQPGPEKRPGTVEMTVLPALPAPRDRKTYLADLQAAINGAPVA